MKALNRIAMILLVVGGLNRGLYAWLDLNLVAWVFPDAVTTAADGTTTTTVAMLAKIVYSLVALSAIWIFIGKCCCNNTCDMHK